MCFKPKRNPKIDAQLEKQRAEAEAAKKKAQEELAAQKAAALEAAKESAEAGTNSQVTEGQEYRQAETASGNQEPPSLAATARRSRRGGRGGRRSLLTASTAQGYFSRFL